MNLYLTYLCQVPYNSIFLFTSCPKFYSIGSYWPISPDPLLQCLMCTAPFPHPISKLPFEWPWPTYLERSLAGEAGGELLLVDKLVQGEPHEHRQAGRHH